MKNDKQLYFALGLAQKAGKLASGDQGVEDALKKGQACLVLMASDVSDRTRDRLESLCRHYKVPVRQALTMADIGLAIGRSPRAAVVILDHHFLQLMV
jgi:ribosomal protein L7Ae-like RNA K-turn-binding protein